MVPTKLRGIAGARDGIDDWFQLSFQEVDLLGIILRYFDSYNLLLHHSDSLLDEIDILLNPIIEFL